jgi:hypothetical protein
VRLIILAESNGHQAFTQVTVAIQDWNDNPPRFAQSVYQASVSEGQFYSVHVIQVTECVCVCMCVTSQSLYVKAPRTHDQHIIKF